MTECYHVWRDSPSPKPKSSIDELLKSIIGAGDKGWWLRGCEVDLASPLIDSGKVKICKNCGHKAVIAIKYILKNLKTGLYFKGYFGKGKGPGNKPVWTEKTTKALQLDLDIAKHIRRRLFCQSQFVELIPVMKSEV